MRFFTLFTSQVGNPLAVSRSIEFDSARKDAETCKETTGQQAFSHGNSKNYRTVIGNANGTPVLTKTQAAAQLEISNPVKVQHVFRVRANPKMDVEFLAV